MTDTTPAVRAGVEALERADGRDADGSEYDWSYLESNQVTFIVLRAIAADEAVFEQAMKAVVHRSCLFALVNVWECAHTDCVVRAVLDSLTGDERWQPEELESARREAAETAETFGWKEER